METTTKNLISRSLSALKWSYLGVMARIVLQLVAQIAIARLIGPKAFGSASAAIFVMTLVNLIVELGLGSSLIQKAQLTSDDLRLVMRRVFLAAGVGAMVVYFSAEAIADFWGDRAVMPLLQALVVALLAQAGGVVSLALLRRELNFKWIQVAQISGYFVGFFVIGITVAVFDGGAWSLVFAWIAQNLCTTILLFWRARHPVNFWGPTANADQSIQSYGVRILLTNLANWVIENIDNFMVGRAFGTYALGTYTVSYNLVRTPTNHLVTSIQQVLFPASARSMGNNDDHGLAYLVVVWGISLVAFPIFLSIAALSGTVVDALYGSKWLTAADILLPLALGMPFHAVMAVGGPMLWGRGEAGREMRVQFVIAPILVLVLGAMANMSPTAMAWGVAGVYVFRAIWIQAQVAAAMKISVASVCWAIVPGGVIGAVVASILWIANAYWITISVSSFPRLLLAGFAGLLMSALALLFMRKLLPKTIGIALRKRTDLPMVMQRVLGLN